MPKPEAPDARVDYYAVLGVRETASRDEIARAFRARSKSWHPDVSDEPDAARRFRQIVRAYDVLGDETLRAQYDRMRAHVPAARYAGRVVARIKRRLHG